VGCGACSVATSGRIPVTIRPRGYYQADVTGASPADRAAGSRVCPFADESKNEDEISADVFPTSMPVDERLGRVHAAYAGRINDDGITRSSSGGMTTWLVDQLLKRGLVDGVVHVGSTDDPLFSYSVSTSHDELLQRRKSKYYPATFDQALLSIRGDGKRYAFVGIPCVVKSARLLVEEDPVLKEQIAYFVGIVCGHLKSAAYALSFAWQMGIEPDDVETVDFRVKVPGKNARRYNFGAKSRTTGEWVDRSTTSFVGGSWGHGVFQLNACNFCDDVFAETADVVCGDGWLPKYEAEWRGTNVVITRNEELDAIVREGARSRDLTLEVLPLEQAAETQLGGLRHKRTDLALRLADADDAGEWRPRKRVSPSRTSLTAKRAAIVRKRREIAATSHEAFERSRAAGELEVYLEAIQPLIDEYKAIDVVPRHRRLKYQLRDMVWKTLRWGRGVVRRR
jgi:coenzyme F420 hydrogenase subunit beta